MRPVSFRLANRSQGGGFALVMVLAVLVLILILVMAFFSRAQLSRKISSSSVAKQQVEILTDSAVELLVSDLIHEIAAGSEQDPLAATLPADGVRVFRPLLEQNSVEFLGGGGTNSTAPSMVPQRVVADLAAAPGNLLKQSLRNRQFFSNGPGVTNTALLPAIPDRAAAVSTEDLDSRGRAISAERWAKPRFNTDGKSVSAPDWIYIDRKGATPTTVTSGWRDRAKGNTEFIIGRFAYNLYDVGGLIDVNAVGNVLPVSENGNRGRLHQVSLSAGPGGLKIPRFAEFVNWRSAADDSATTDSDALFDPARTFMDVMPGSQALVTRQDLLNYGDAEHTIPAAAWPFLTTFSRAMNAPIYEPEPGRPLLPAGGGGDSTAEQLNPKMNAIRFASETTLSRGTDPSVTVPAGTPLMARRFPLGKLDLLADDSADPEDLKYYFGLERQSDGSFHYTETSPDGRIKRLDEIVTEGREPNFFELLQATILTGSLGRNAGNSTTIDEPRDVLRNQQVIQIGANIIDQWDSDDLPIALGYPSGNTGYWEMAYGTENLPYINSMEFVVFHPEWDLDRLQIWALFSVWNPHQNAAAPAKEITGFRIQPVSGSMHAAYAYQINFNRKRLEVGGYRSTGDQSIIDLNNGREVSFPNDGSYLEPTVIGNAAEPTSEDYNGGLLLNQISHNASNTKVKYMPPVVPENLLDLDDDARMSVNAILEEMGREKAPPDGGGEFGAKTFNYFRLFGLNGDRPVIHLQYRQGGAWHTYQVIEDLFPSSADPVPFSGRAYGSITKANFVGKASAIVGTDGMLEVTPDEVDRVSLASAQGWDASKKHSFYGWRYDGPEDDNSTFISAFKFDPRSIRFGHSGAAAAALGPQDAPKAHTIRTSVIPPNWRSYPTPKSLVNAKEWKLVLSEGLSGFANVPGYVHVFSPNPYPDFQWSRPGGIYSYDLYTPAGFIRNIPEGNLDTDVNPSRYKDRDGIIRPADGYLGALPTVSPVTASGIGSKDDRPILLNRRFRSVGEMGYAFRDLPWKTLDFFTRNSGDLGLLDVFSIDESTAEIPLGAGKVNLNFAPVEVLQAVLEGAAKTIDQGDLISASEAERIAKAIVNERETNGPFSDVGDLVMRVLSPNAADDPGVIADVRKHEREAAIRVLSAIGTTRTWNFLIDMIVQSGRMTPQGQNAADFIVRAEHRVWVHLALDRLTGEIVDQSWEVVDE